MTRKISSFLTSIPLQKTATTIRNPIKKNTQELALYLFDLKLTLHGFTQPL